MFHWSENEFFTNWIVSWNDSKLFKSFASFDFWQLLSLDCAKFSKSQKIIWWFFLLFQSCFIKTSDIYLNISIFFYRYSNSAGQNATKTLRRRRIHERQNGPRHSEKVLAKNWQWILHLSLKSVEMHLSNTTENYGNKQVRSSFL